MSKYNFNTSKEFFINYAGLFPDPDILFRDRGIDYEALRNLKIDSHLESCMEGRESGLLRNEWHIVCARNRGNAAKARDFIEDVFRNIETENLFMDILDAVYFGFAAIEKEFIRDGLYYRYNSLLGKPPEWFQFNEEGELFFLSKDHPFKGEKVDMRYLELIQNRPKYKNPYGEKKLSKVFWPVMFKKGDLKHWLDFIDRYSGFFLHLKTNNPDQKNIDDMLTELQEMRSGSVAVSSTADQLDVHAFTSDGSKVFDAFKDYCDKEISKAILGQTLTTQSDGGTGSYAMSKIHYMVRADILESDRKLITRTINKLIKQLIDLNFKNIPNADYPEFKFFEEEDIRAERAERDKKLFEIGVEFTPEYFEANYGLKKGHFSVSSKKEREDQQPSLFPDLDKGESGKKLTARKGKELKASQKLSLID